jgi:hypothetical protein
MMPLAIYQVIDGKVVTILVSNGFCQLKKDTREHLTSSLTNSMFERVDPAYAGKLAKQGAAFTNHESKYDVVYRSNDVDGKADTIAHVVISKCHHLAPVAHRHAACRAHSIFLSPHLLHFAIIQ